MAYAGHEVKIMDIRSYVKHMRIKDTAGRLFALILPLLLPSVLLAQAGDSVRTKAGHLAVAADTGKRKNPADDTTILRKNSDLGEVVVVDVDQPARIALRLGLGFGFALQAVIFGSIWQGRLRSQRAITAILSLRFRGRCRIIWYALESIRLRREIVHLDTVIRKMADVLGEGLVAGRGCARAQRQ